MLEIVIETGIITSIIDFFRMAFSEYAIGISFLGAGVDEKEIVDSIDSAKLLTLGINSCYLKAGDTIIAVDPRYFRPTEVDLLIGDPTKAQNVLNWKPKYDLSALVSDMMNSDLKLMLKEKFLVDSGHQILTNHE